VKDKVRLRFLLLALLAACLLIFVAYRHLSEEFMVDRCLSAYHGSFNYSDMTCDLETNHSSVPYQSRHPLDIWVAAFAFVSFVSLVGGYYYKRTNQKNMIPK
jgi:hypothetical protein